jgi:hypothetical protein
MIAPCGWRSRITVFSWHLRASARGWAAMYSKKNPWSSQRRVSRSQWERAALDQRLIAVNSILRDWVKGEITAIETGT